VCWWYQVFREEKSMFDVFQENKEAARDDQEDGQQFKAVANV
jgi:hypothetical protein